MGETTVKFTYSDLLTVPEDTNRYEIFEGELIVSPSPTERHQNALSNLFGILKPFVRNNKLGKIYTVPFDVFFDEETVVEPDILFIFRENLSIIEERCVKGPPDLIIEITSLKTESRDRGYKYRRYAKERVKEYWIVDPEKQFIEIFVLKDSDFELVKRYSGNDLVTSPLLSGLKFNVPEVWE